MRLVNLTHLSDLMCVLAINAFVVTIRPGEKTNSETQLGNVFSGKQIVNSILFVLLDSGEVACMLR